jgi:hypothetical protein
MPPPSTHIRIVRIATGSDAASSSTSNDVVDAAFLSTAYVPFLLLSECFIMIYAYIFKKQSKECQRSHWPEHKIVCNDVITEDKEIEAETGIARGYTDLMQWVEFYSTPMKNCMVAALNLPHFPHQERDSVLAICITHKRDATLPLQHRFTIDAISRYNRNDPEDRLAARELIRRLDSAEMQNTIKFGKAEMGSNYYGTLMIVVIAFFSVDPFVSIPIYKSFSIDKSTASAKVMDGPWWPPLRHILENGLKMKFCCGKIEGVGCCCRGWIHGDTMKGDAWR